VRRISSGNGLPSSTRPGLANASPFGSQPRSLPSAPAWCAERRGSGRAAQQRPEPPAPKARPSMVPTRNGPGLPHQPERSRLSRVVLIAAHPSRPTCRLGTMLRTCVTGPRASFGLRRTAARGRKPPPPPPSGRPNRRTGDALVRTPPATTRPPNRPDRKAPGGLCARRVLGWTPCILRFGHCGITTTWY
jgi:hypothetical protein